LAEYRAKGKKASKLRPIGGFQKEKGAESAPPGIPKHQEELRIVTFLLT